MFNVGPEKLLLVFLVALIVLGPQRLPEVARQIGRAMAELRKLSHGFQTQVRDAISEEPAVPDAPTVNEETQAAVTPGAPSSST